MPLPQRLQLSGLISSGIVKGGEAASFKSTVMKFSHEIYRWVTLMSYKCKVETQCCRLP